MSRVIKEFPYNEEIKDTVVCSVSDIEKIVLPGSYLSISKDFKNYDLFIDLRVSAEDEHEGIKLTALTRENDERNPEDLRGKAVSVVLNEIEFVDGIYNAITARESLGNSEFMKNLISTSSVAFSKEFVFPNGYYVKTNEGQWINEI